MQLIYVAILKRTDALTSYFHNTEYQIAVPLDNGKDEERPGKVLLYERGWAYIYGRGRITR